MSTDTHSDDDIARCSSCGGEIPPEGSVAWEESDGDCPGHVATGSTVCGAFDPALPWDEEDDADESDEEEDDAEDDEPVDPRTGETLAAFTERHEGEGHVVWTGEGEAFAYVSQEDCDADAASSGELSDDLVIEVWDASGAKR